MVGKTYLKYEEGAHSGVICSPLALHLCSAQMRAKGAATVVAPSLEAVHGYNSKTGQIEFSLVPGDMKMSAASEVSAIRLQPTGVGFILTVGYATGKVAVFRRGADEQWQCDFHALGHKPDTAVLSLGGDSQSTLLCSGGQDTDITLWDAATQDSTYRLKGHRGAVVSVHFVPKRDDVLVSGSADGLIKIWDLKVQQCVQTIVASDTQITSLLLDVGGFRIYCGLRENTLKVFDLLALSSAAAGSVVAGDEVVLHSLVTRKTNKPVTSMAFSSDGAFLAIISNKSVELCRVLSSEDIKKKEMRKKKRRRDDGTLEAVEEPQTHTAAASIVPLRIFFLEEKIRGLCFVPALVGSEKGSATIRLAASLANNAIHFFTTSVTESEIEGGKTLSLTDLTAKHTIEHNGHRGDIKRLQFSDDDSALISMSSESLKLWNVSVRSEYSEQDDANFYLAKETNLQQRYRSGLTCSGSVALTDATACAVLTEEVVCVGQSNGSLIIVNAVAGVVVHTEPAHVGEVRHVTRRPDLSGFTSVGADRRLLVWDVALLADKKSVTLRMVHEVELNETPLFVQHSPDLRLIAVGLQDHNIQLFFADTLKPFLSLFGHKLPPVAAAFTTDGTLVASVGMDKSLRFWGTDFGDCHKAVHAHDDYVTSVAFVPGTHYCFTCSLDGSIKHWDGDTWTLTQIFRIHQQGLWTICVNSNGTCAVASGKDRSIRLLLRTEEILFPQEEEERRAQEAMDEEDNRRSAVQRLEEKDAEVGVVGQKSLASNTAAENLMDALDLASVELQRMADTTSADTTSVPHPLLKNTTVWAYLWNVIESIKPSEMRHALSSLTSTHISALLHLLHQMLTQRAVQNYEIASKIVLSLVLPPLGSTTGRPLTTLSGDELALLASIRDLVAQGLATSVSRMDYTVAAIEVVMQELQEKEKTIFYDISKVQGYKKKYHSSANQQPRK